MTMREILDKVRNIEDRLERIEKERKKRNLPFEACIPPKDLCKELVAIQFVDDFKGYEYHMQRLADYYSIEPMGNYHSPEKVPEKSIACYQTFEGDAYYKKNPITLDVVLHEFFHHLHAKNVVRLDGKSEEQLADRFAKIVMKRGGEG